jgi:transcription initiation factor TFIIE subunit beta
VQEQATKIQIDASKDRARLDARSNAQQERLKKAAEAEQRLKQARLDEISSIRARRNRVPSLLLLLASVRPRPAPRALPLSSSSSLLLSLFRPQERELAERALAPPTHAHEVATSILMKQKRVMDLLAKTRKPFNAVELRNELGFPVDVPELWDMLLHNDKLFYDERVKRFSYKAKHALADRREMLAFIQKRQDGVLVEDVVDAYANALDDAEALIEAKLVMTLHNAETRKRVLYPLDDAYEAGDVSETTAGLFHGVELPAEDDAFDAALRAIGEEPAPRRDTRGGKTEDDDEFDAEGNRKIKTKKKRAVNFERMKLTNVHLPEMFKKGAAGDGVDRLDG